MLRLGLGRAFLSSSASQAKKRNTIRRLMNANQTETEPAPLSPVLKSSLLKAAPIVAACTSEAYDFQKLLPFLQKNFHLSPFISDDVMHVKSAACSASPFIRPPFSVPGEIFFFRNGSLVFWAEHADAEESHITSELREKLLPALKPFQLSSYSEPDFEELSYKSGTNLITGIVDETVVLNEDTISIKEKLAFSNGLADSVKLGVLERMMDEHIDKVRSIPLALMTGGKIPLSRRQMLKLTGELLHFRAQLNLSSDLIDKPDIYWSEPKLEDLYIKISRVLENRIRTAVLNKKLDYSKEMAQVMSDHLAEKHGLKLEWGIIALIAVEVAFETFHLLEKILFASG